MGHNTGTQRGKIYLRLVKWSMGLIVLIVPGNEITATEFLDGLSEININQLLLTVENDA